MTGSPRNDWLLVGGGLSMAAALLHLACIAGGPDWYRALGAGERMARMVEAGRLGPLVVTVAIAAVLAAFGAYAWSGAGVLPRLPFLRPVLIAITSFYMVRGFALFAPSMMRRPDLSPAFLLWSSAIVLGLGLVHLAGIWRGWSALQGVS